MIDNKIPYRLFLVREKGWSFAGRTKHDYIVGVCFYARQS